MCVRQLWILNSTGYWVSLAARGTRASKIWAPRRVLQYSRSALLSTIMVQLKTTRGLCSELWLLEKGWFLGICKRCGRLSYVGLCHLTVSCTRFNDSLIGTGHGPDKMCCDISWHGRIWFDIIFMRHDMTWYYMILHDTTLYYIIFYDMMWYHMALHEIYYDIVWYCMIYDVILHDTLCVVGVTPFECMAFGALNYQLVSQGHVLWKFIGQIYEWWTINNSWVVFTVQVIYIILDSLHFNEFHTYLYTYI